jgi:type IV secretion system protein TrbL
MVASKLLLVVIFGIGVSVLNGAGMDGSQPTQVVTQLAVGSLILLMGGFAPWIAIRMFHFAGDALQAAHATASQSSAGAKTVIAAPQKVSSAMWQARSLTGGASALTGGARAKTSLPSQRSQIPAALYASPPPPNRSSLQRSPTSSETPAESLPPAAVNAPIGDPTAPERPGQHGPPSAAPDPEQAPAPAPQTQPPQTQPPPKQSPPATRPKE